MPVSLDCPICGVRLGPSDPGCSGCGFPVGLHPEAQRGLRSEETVASPATSPRSTGGSRRAAAAAATQRPRDQTAEACARAARELQGHLALIRQLGGNTLPYTGGLRQAALVQAEGKLAESLDLLRSAEMEANHALTELFAQRAQELEGREASLQQFGIRSETKEPLERLHAAMAASERAEAAVLVVDIDRRIGNLERDWRGLHALMEQIDALQSGARAAGRPLPEVEDDLQAVKALLARPQVDAEIIDSASQISARALMLLHESLPEILEKDLDRHGAALSAYPSEHEPSRRAKALHSEVSRHLRRSRLGEAAEGLAELRRELRRLEQLRTEEPAPTPPAAKPPVRAAPAPKAQDPDEALPRLLEKARALASRVRALAPESDTAYEAAGEIRRATELLKARKLDEADAALTHLMKTLDSAPPEER